MIQSAYSCVFRSCFSATLCSLMFCVLPLSGFSNGSAHAQEDVEKLPSAKDVIDRYINAVGGYEILESIQTIHSVSRGHSGSGAFTYESFRAPGKSRTTYLYDSDERTDRGLAQGVAWEINRGSPIREMAGEELEDFIHKNKFCISSPQWPNTFKTIEMDGIERAIDAECYKLKMTRANGEVTFKHFDIETGLLVRSECKEIFSETTHTVIREYEDYRESGEIKTAFKQTIRFADSVFVFNTETIEFDSKIPASTFKLPRSMALSAKRKKLALQSAAEAAAKAKTEAETANEKEKTESESNDDGEDSK